MGSVCQPGVDILQQGRHHQLLVFELHAVHHADVHGDRQHDAEDRDEHQERVCRRHDDKGDDDGHRDDAAGNGQGFFPRAVAEFAQIGKRLIQSRNEGA